MGPAVHSGALMPARLSLCSLPTPLHRLPNMSRLLGIDLWIKRDDLTGFAAGGNKGRKLEFLIADALERGADTVVSCGSQQSNFIRQLAAACSKFGLGCEVATMDLPFEPTAPKPSPVLSQSGGNAVLAQLSGARIHGFPDGTWDELFGHAERLATHLEMQGQRVYRMPLGGSSPLGAYSFVLAADELRSEGHFEWLVCASSSGSTHAGLAYALHGSETRVVGVCCDPEPEIVHDLAVLTAGLDELLGEQRSVAAEYLDLRLDYVGPGYGVPSEQGLAATRLMAREEGIYLDPVYTAKAFAGLIEMARQGALSGRVLFWHTGGFPSIFTLPEAMLLGEP